VKKFLLVLIQVLAGLAVAFTMHNGGENIPWWGHVIGALCIGYCAAWVWYFATHTTIQVDKVDK
jgi:hypothetical protein